MKLSLMFNFLVITLASNAMVFEDNFDNNVGGDGGGTGFFAKPWIIEGTLWGGAGTEDGTSQPAPPTESNWAFFQTRNGANEDAAISIDTGAALLPNTVYMVNFTTGSRSDNVFAGTFSVEIWDGSPTANGTLLDSSVVPNLTGNLQTKAHSYPLNSSSSVSGNLYLRFFADTPSAGSYSQPLLDSVSIINLSAPPSSSMRSRTPIMGWSSWNNFKIDINEQMIREQADAMVSSGMKAAGYRYINTDDGYFGGRDSAGVLFCDYSKFPSGMKAQADYIHSKGLKAGIYSDAGADTCASIWDDDPLGYDVGLYNYDQEDLTLMLLTWGYDFIKVDWCGGQRLSLSAKTRYMEIGRVIRELRSDVVYNVCRWSYPGAWTKYASDSWRISGDIHASFSSVMGIMDRCEPLWIHCSPGRFNDMDMLQIGRGMTEDEDKSHFAMWCMMNSPLLAGNDLRSMSQTTIDILTSPEIIALNQDVLCYQARRLRDDGDTELWAKPMVEINGGDIAVTLLNRHWTEQTISFDLSEIGLDASAGYSIRDLWQQTTLTASTTATSQSFTVPLHGVVVLRIKGTALSNHPFTPPPGWTYIAWANEMGLTTGNASPFADPDGDGMCNMKEFAFEDHDPLFSDAHPILTRNPEDLGMVTRFRLMNTDEAIVVPQYQYGGLSSNGWNNVVNGQDQILYTTDIYGSKITAQSSQDNQVFFRLVTSLDIPITDTPNLSFEEPVCEAGTWKSGSPLNWSFSDGGGVENVNDPSRYGSADDFGTSPTKLNQQGGDGDQVGFLSVPDATTSPTASSSIIAKVEANTVYTLTIAFGQRSSGVQLPDGEIGLGTLANNLGTFTSFQGSSFGTGFHDVTYSWTSPDADDPLIGQSINIQMRFTYNASVGGWQQAQFDKIRITQTPAP